MVLVVRMKFTRTTYISQRVWRSIFPELRRAILRVTGLRRTDIVSNTMYIATLEDRLRRHGEHDLANALMSTNPHGHFEQYLLANKEDNIQ